MDAIAELLSSGTFTRNQAVALRQLLGLVESGGGDPAGTAATLVAAHEAASNPHPTYLTQAEADTLYAAIGGAGDPWTHITLASDFVYSGGTTANDLTGMAFTPAANKNYLFEFRGAWVASSIAANTGLQMGIDWPTGMTSGGATEIIGASNASAVRGAGLGSTIGAHGMTTPAINTPYPVMVSGYALAGATPSGTIKLTIRTATAGAHTVTMKAGSVLSWRELP